MSLTINSASNVIQHMYLTVWMFTRVVDHNPTVGSLIIALGHVSDVWPETGITLRRWPDPFDHVVANKCVIWHPLNNMAVIKSCWKEQHSQGQGNPQKAVWTSRPSHKLDHGPMYWGMGLSFHEKFLPAVTILWGSIYPKQPLSPSL